MITFRRWQHSWTWWWCECCHLCSVPLTGPTSLGSRCFARAGSDFERIFVRATSASGSRPGALRGDSQPRACACMLPRHEPPASLVRAGHDGRTQLRLSSTCDYFSSRYAHTPTNKHRERSAQRSILSARVVDRLSTLADSGGWHLWMRVDERAHGALRQGVSGAPPPLTHRPSASRAAPGRACPKAPRQPHAHFKPPSHLTRLRRGTLRASTLPVHARNAPRNAPRNTPRNARVSRVRCARRVCA